MADVKLSPRQRDVLSGVIRGMESGAGEHSRRDFGSMNDQELFSAFDGARGRLKDRGGDENVYSEALMGVGLVLLPKDRIAEWEAWNARSLLQKLMDAARGVEGPQMIRPEKGVAVRFSMDDLRAEAKEYADRAGPTIERGPDLER